VSQSPSPSTTSPRLGLRERKKVKLRRSAQREALRLFAEQGYEATTVEEIADAADISTSTFYRYFPTQEDVVLDDEYDPIVEQIIGSKDDNQPLVTTVRVAIAALAAAVELERDAALARLKLLASVPALRARQGAEGRKTFDFYLQLSRTARAARSMTTSYASPPPPSSLPSWRRHAAGPTPTARNRWPG
jgi:AcrR family transcriptional regulator